MLYPVSFRGGEDSSDAGVKMERVQDQKEKMLAELLALWTDQCDQLRKKKEQFATEVRKTRVCVSISRIQNYHYPFTMRQEVVESSLNPTSQRQMAPHGEPGSPLRFPPSQRKVILTAVTSEQGCNDTKKLTVRYYRVI